MERKRTNLDTAEAEFLYANSLVEFNKYENFQKLSIPERNNLVDEVCLEALRKSCKDDNHIDAVSKEILSYKLTKEEEHKYYSSDKYVKGLERPENFDEMLKVKYVNLISNIISHSTIHK